MKHQIFSELAMDCSGKAMESASFPRKRWKSQTSLESKWQRRMGVEPTRDRAERPPSRFEDGETHRGPYTSMPMTTGRIVPLTLALVKREHFNHQSARLYLPDRS